jgi:UDP-glucose 4-epimerase
MQSKSPIESVPYSEAYAAGFQDMQRRKPIVEKLFRAVGFKPETPLERIVRLTVTGATLP